MADFPPNLDDGELWLPSDIIRDVGARHPPHHQLHPRPLHHSTAAAYDLDYVEGLAQQLASLRLLEARAAAVATLIKPSPPPHRPLYLGPFGPADGEVRLSGSPYDRFRDLAAKKVALFSRNSSGLGTGFRAGDLSGYNLVKLNERFGGPMVHGFQTGPVVQRRLGPAVQPTTGGLRRESGGTGVFFPRVGNIKFDSDGKGTKRKPQVVRVGGEQQQQQNRTQVGTKNGVVVLKHQQQLQQQDGMLFHPPTEMALPADWTY